MSHSHQQYALSGSSVSSILNPQKQKIARNHQADYVQQLRQMQRENRIRKERERYETDKKQFKMKKFEGVKSKVDVSAPQALLLQQDKENTLNDDDVPITKAFSKINKDQVRQASMQNKQAAIIAEKKQKIVTKPEVPKHNETLELKPRESKNYLSKNTKAAIQAKPTKTTSAASSEESKHKSYGKVPKYLEEFKNEKLEEEERQRSHAAKRKDCPPGMMLMPEDERLETLRCLEENKQTVNGQLMRFPIICDTVGLKKRKSQLEQKLQEIEDAIKLFSRPRVFVAE